MSIAPRLREHLQKIAEQQVPITYRELAKALGLTTPNTIHQVTEALEHLMAEDAAADRPFIAAIVISKARGGLLTVFYSAVYWTMAARLSVPALIANTIAFLLTLAAGWLILDEPLSAGFLIAVAMVTVGTLLPRLPDGREALRRVRARRSSQHS